MSIKVQLEAHARACREARRRGDPAPSWGSGSLREADLRGAHLTGADLREADLRGAHLTGADLTGADLDGAHLDGAYLGGAAGIRSAGPVGRSGRIIYGVAHESGAMVQAGCWWGSVEDTIARIRSEYEGDEAEEYIAAVRWVGSVKMNAGG